MALPTSRNTTYSAGSQVKSADLNDIQDKIVDLHTDGEVYHVERTLAIPAAAGSSTPSDTNAGWQYQPSVGATACAWRSPEASGAAVVIPIPLKVGDRIKSVTAHVKDTTGGHTVSLQLRKSTTADANTQVGATQTSAGNGTNQALAVSGLTTVIAAGEYFNAVVVADDATVTTHAVYGVTVVYDRVP